eukprot:scaffold130455_cov23-Prasinocladus_malaysianus.AAC.1
MPNYVRFGSCRLVAVPWPAISMPSAVAYTTAKAFECKGDSISPSSVTWWMPPRRAYPPL